MSLGSKNHFVVATLALIVPDTNAPNAKTASTSLLYWKKTFNSRILRGKTKYETHLPK